jgi:3-isopropylmalate dehydrogenase
MLLNIAILPGDGIGPEVITEAVCVLERVAEAFGHGLHLSSRAVGGAALVVSNDPLPNDTLQACLSSEAVLLGAVGGPAFDSYAPQLRPESGLLRLRRELGVFANLRPAISFPSLEDCSPLRGEIVRHTDLLVVRELLGGIYFGKPRQTEGPGGSRLATDTMTYAEAEIERIANIAFQLARGRRRKVTSVDKANVLDCSRLWRDVVNRVSQQYADVSLAHMYVDSAAMALIARPVDFDVLLTENMFGDILSDLAGGLVGSLGLLASASIGGRVGLYEPVHGSAPEIAGRGIANPLGAILSVAMLLRYTFKLEHEATVIEAAVQEVLKAGHRTRDLNKPQQSAISTSEMGRKVADAASQLAKAAIQSAAN